MALDFPDINQAISRVLSGNTPDVVSRKIKKAIGQWDIGHQPQSIIASRIRGLYDDIYVSAIEDRRYGR